MKISKYIMLAAVVGIMAGCDNSTDVVVVTTAPASETSTYYPLTPGDTYTYRYVTLDSGNAERSGSVRFDSVYVDTAASILKRVTFLESRYSGGLFLGSDFVSRESRSAYRFMVPVTLDSVFPIKISERWVQEANFLTNVPSWVTFDTSVTNIPVKFGTDSGFVDMRIVQTRTKNSSVPVSFGNAQTANAIEITSTTNYDGTITIAGASPLEVSLKFNDVEKVHFVDSIGIVKRHRDFYKIEANFLKRNVSGFDYTLQSYNKK